MRSGQGLRVGVNKSADGPHGKSMAGATGYSSGEEGLKTPPDQGRQQQPRVVRQTAPPASADDIFVMGLSTAFQPVVTTVPTRRAVMEAPET
jgi:hypothetical protein